MILNCFTKIDYYFFWNWGKSALNQCQIEYLLKLQYFWNSRKIFYWITLWNIDTSTLTSFHPFILTLFLTFSFLLSSPIYFHPSIFLSSCSLSLFPWVHPLPTFHSLLFSSKDLFSILDVTFISVYLPPTPYILLSLSSISFNLIPYPSSINLLPNLFIFQLLTFSNISNFFLEKFRIC